VFIGHFAVAFAAKRVAPEVSLGTLMLAAQFADLVWPVLVLLGVEVVVIRPGITAMTPLDFVHYPWSHSLVALGVWAGLLAAAVVWRNRPTGGAAVAWTAQAIWLLVAWGYWIERHRSVRT